MDGFRVTGTIIRRLAIVLILGATFAASAMITVYALFHSGEVQVPNVVGMTEDEARRAIERAGLTFKTRRVHFDSEVPQGAVTEQDPAPNFPVKAGFQVKVDVSKGPNPTGGPDEPEDIPIGPNAPVEENANKNDARPAKKRPDTNANKNTAAPAATNTNASTGTERTPSASEPKPATTEPAEPRPARPDASDDAKPKPERPTPPPAPPTR